MTSKKDIGRFLITYDPEQAQQTKTEFAALALSPLEQLPAPLLANVVTWPAGVVPTPKPLSPAPPETDDLTKFAGYDVVVVTWTTAEATTLATLFTPGFQLKDWYEYRHDIATYVPLVTGTSAPFNGTDPRDARYNQSLGLYFPCMIGNTKVLLFKSGLHFVYDGPAFPVAKLMKEIHDAVNPKVFITTGTGGAIGKDVLLGDVVIAPQVTFDCSTAAYINEYFNKVKYNTTPLPVNFMTGMPASLLKVNGARVTGGNPVPKMWSDNSSLIVTTDIYQYDDVQNTANLQGLGRACDMGDAMVALALKDIAGLQFFAIRNASDPQMPVPDSQQHDDTKTSYGVYHYWGGVTTAASVIATWKLITSIYPQNTLTVNTFKITVEKPSNILTESLIFTKKLDNRNGYDPNFLGISLPLPQLTSNEQKQNVAKVLTDVGPKGDGVLDYTHFSVVFNKSTKLPFYTAVNNVGKSSLIGKVHDARGSDVWHQDDRITNAGITYQYGNADYTGSDLAKGHMVRYYDPAWGTDDEAKIAMGDTFHYTNCCPQVAYFNGVVWNYLEDYSIALSMFNVNEVTIFAGPIFNKAETINGLLVPLNFWKIIVYEKDGKLSAQGFVMSQEPYIKNLKQKATLLEEALKQVNPTLTPASVKKLFEKQDLILAQTKIALIEDKTGLSFGLNDADEFKDKPQYALKLISKTKGVNTSFERFSESIDTAKWSSFLMNL